MLTFQDVRLLSSSSSSTFVPWNILLWRLHMINKREKEKKKTRSICQIGKMKSIRASMPRSDSSRRTQEKPHYNRTFQTDENHMILEEAQIKKAIVSSTSVWAQYVRHVWQQIQDRFELRRFDKSMINKKSSTSAFALFEKQGHVFYSDTL